MNIPGLKAQQLHHVAIRQLSSPLHYHSPPRSFYQYAAELCRDIWNCCGGALSGDPVTSERYGLMGPADSGAAQPRHPPSGVHPAAFLARHTRLARAGAARHARPGRPALRPLPFASQASPADRVCAQFSAPESAGHAPIQGTPHLPSPPCSSTADPPSPSLQQHR